MPEHEITGETTIEELLRNPRAFTVLVRYGIPCPMCPLARFEMSQLRLRDVAEAYNVDLEGLLKALREAIRRAS